MLAPRPGSTHGYDVIDHGRVNPELGGTDALEALAAGLRARGMGLLLDVVPNHMCVSTNDNAWWNDVLENGPSARWARAFDIEWSPPNPHLADKVLLPILGDQFGHVLERGELRVVLAETGAFSLQYWDWRLPLAPKSWPAILAPALDALRRSPSSTHAVDVLESILLAIRNLPERSERDPERLREREREREIIRERLASLWREHPAARRAVDEAIETLNGVIGAPRSFDALDALLREQAYRLAHWRVASDEINYRRFFDINELAALRVEDPAVFDAVHALTFALVDRGIVTGLRIDHVDGLRDPHGYLHALRQRCPETYLVVEKILAAGERVPDAWPVEGTTGYDFLNLSGGLFVDGRGARRLLERYRRDVHENRSFDDIAYACKKLVLRRSLQSQLAMLTQRLDRISEQHRHSRDFTPRELGDALEEIVAALDVYRTYLGPDAAALAEQDHAAIDRAVARARRRAPAMNASVFDFVHAVLALKDPDGITEEQRVERRDFVLRLQQLTGAVTAKAIEDTAFYRFYPLSSRGEVGGDPASAGVSVQEFHEESSRRAIHLRSSMLATATHDTKRGEDLRARIRVLSEAADAWGSALERFRTMNARHRTLIDGVYAPDANEEYLLYQTLVGAVPMAVPDNEVGAALVERVRAYMIKALREAKVHTSWVNRNERWESAVLAFVDRVLADHDNPFLHELLRFARPLARVAVYGALGQIVLKVASPGVPDFYQGSELWDEALVDPDNRRAVDFTLRRRLLAEVVREAAEGPDALTALAARWLQRSDEGAIKLLVTKRALDARRAARGLFSGGAYEPLPITGDRADNAVAFARVHGNEVAIAVVGLQMRALGAGAEPPVGERLWGSTRLALPESLQAATLTDALTGRVVSTHGGTSLRIGSIFTVLPVALLMNRGVRS